MKAWLSIVRGEAPLLLSMPHAGTDLAGLESRLVSPWLARMDTDWWIPELYEFATALGASVVRTSISRTVIDVNRDPTGQSLYPGMASTGLCPTTTFDGAPLYHADQAPSEEEVATRRAAYFDPYHAALHAEIARLRALHPRVVVYDCHSIRSSVPRLFDGTLPQFNIGTNDGHACDDELVARVQAACLHPDFSQVVNGRFKGGYITRSLGAPARGVHALQIELACRGYLREPAGPPDEYTWPVTFDPAFAAPLQQVLRHALLQCLQFATEH